MARHTIHLSTSNESFTIDDRDYDLQLVELTPERVNKSGSQALVEMIAQTGATHHGTVNYRGVKGANKELNKHIDVSQNGFVENNDGIPCFVIH